MSITSILHRFWLDSGGLDVQMGGMYRDPLRWWLRCRAKSIFRASSTIPTRRRKSCPRDAHNCDPEEVMTSLSWTMLHGIQQKHEYKSGGLGNSQCICNPNDCYIVLVRSILTPLQRVPAQLIIWHLPPKRSDMPAVMAAADVSVPTKMTWKQHHLSYLQ